MTHEEQTDIRPEEEGCREDGACACGCKEDDEDVETCCGGGCCA